MPNINLRLSEEEHEQLRAWAHDGRRSLQKEIIFRLFTIEGAQAPKVGLAVRDPGQAIEVPPDGTMVELPAASARRAADTMTELVEAAPDYDHFKPDPKGKR